ncbi:hypothetical protein DXG01_012931, partial [Tephrocybe rancida]
MASSDPSCYTIALESSAEYPSTAELRSGLEKGLDEVKLDTLRKIVISTINGNPQLKKLLHFYWDVCPKYDETGKLKQEILVANIRTNTFAVPLYASFRKLLKAPNFWNPSSRPNAHAPAPEPEEGKHQLVPRSRALRSLHMLHEHDTHPERPHTHPREGERKLEPEHTHPNP